MIDLREIRSVTEFQRNIKGYVSRLKEQKTPLVLTVNGRAELVVQDAESYQEILDRLERAEATAAIRNGIEQFGSGEGIALRNAEARLRKKIGRRARELFWISAPARDRI
jgi:prevent-host-death family protein